jgi:hypothetical protein
MMECSSAKIYATEGPARYFEIGEQGCTRIQMFDGGGGEAASLEVTHMGHKKVFYGIPFECVEAMAREGRGGLD